MAFDPEIREDIDALIAEAARQIALVEAMYEEALHERKTGGTLRVQIKNVLENQRSALEYLANGLHDALGGQPSSRIYFPIANAPKDFPALIKGQMPQVALDSPLYEAFAACQPYERGYECIGHLAVLTRQNKHHRLTPQTRDETEWVSITAPGGGGIGFQPYQEGKGGVIFGGQVTIGQGSNVTRTIFVDWLFDEPRVPVRGTLHEIQQKLPLIVQRILTASGL